MINERIIRGRLMGTWRTHQRQILNYPSKIDFLTGRSSARVNRTRGRVVGEKEREGINISRECKARRCTARRDNVEAVTQKEAVQRQVDARTAWAV